MRKSIRALLDYITTYPLYRTAHSNHGGNTQHTTRLQVIVATSENQRASLDALRARALSNGVHDLRQLSREDVRHLEPEVASVGGLWSPSTGIVDSHGLMEALLADAKAHGAAVSFRTTVTGGRVGTAASPATVVVETPELDLQCDLVFNCAGLAADDVARFFVPNEGVIPALSFAKGNYFNLKRKYPTPFTHLVYPLPETHGLGVHSTLDLDGNVRFGPDVQWQTNATDFTVDPARANAFYPEIRRYWPACPDDGLEPAYAGIRPKLHSAQEPAADFLFVGAARTRVAGVLHLLGMESPGLTASLAIADHACHLLGIEPDPDPSGS